MSKKTKPAPGGAKVKRSRHASARFLTKEGFKNIRVHKLMSIASVTVMMACLLLMGGAYLIYVNIQAVMDRVGSQNVIMVFIEDGATRQEADELGASLAETENVADCVFVSKEEAYKGILDNMGASADIMSDVEADFLPDAYKVTIKDMSTFRETVMSIGSLEHVLSVRENSELATKLASIQRAVWLIGLCIAVILFAVSLFIIANTVRITMFSRSLEISIMKAVGATNTFIRWPFVVEGIVIGFLSSILSFGLVFGLYYTAERVFGTMFEILGSTMVPFESFAPMLGCAFLAVGVFTGMMGSVISLGRYLKEHGQVVNN